VATDVAEREKAELEVISPEEQALIDEAKGTIDTENLVLPAVKLTQSLTKEVEAGDVDAGHFINSLTGEDYGDSVDFVIGPMFKGRFYSDRETNQTYVAQGDIAPDNWPEEYAGKAFVEIADAEEQWKAASNAKEHPWGSGPPISSTHNFVGYVVKDGAIAEDDLPARLSLMRSSTPAAKKLETLIVSGRAQWDRVYTLRAKRDVKNERPYYVIDVEVQGPSSPEIKQRAVHLAQQFKARRDAGQVELSGDVDDGAKKAKPAKGDGLDV